MDLLRQVVQTVLHLSPKAINDLAEAFGPGLYGVLFAIIFAETGLVLLPFLPGDSLLFAVGAVAATPGSPVNFGLTAVLLVVAAVLGDAVNYAIGYSIGPAVFRREDSRLLNTRHLNKAHAFYEQYGGKTIILARFVPIVRTFAPFVAGVARMNYAKFALYNVVGGAAWVVICLAAGYLFGGFTFVQKRFELVILAIILISILPALIEYLRERSRRHSTEPALTALEPLDASRASTD